MDVGWPFQFGFISGIRKDADKKGLYFYRPTSMHQKSPLEYRKISHFLHEGIFLAKAQDLLDASQASIDYLLKVTFSEPPSRMIDDSRGFVSAILRPPLNE